MILKEFNFNLIKHEHPIVGLSIREVGTNKWYTGFIGDVLRAIQKRICR